MKVKVIKKFNDRTKGFERRKVDEIIDVSNERAKDLIKNGFAKKCEEADLKKTSEKEG